MKTDGYSKHTHGSALRWAAVGRGVGVDVSQGEVHKTVSIKDRKGEGESPAQRRCARPERATKGFGRRQAYL